MKKLYLAGPMRGYKNFNFPAFDAAAKELRHAGYEVFSPAERDRQAYGDAIENNPTGDESKVSNPACTIRDCLSADCEWICRHADGVAVLSGWQMSSGANAEVALAKALGLEVRTVGDFLLARPAPPVTAPVTMLHPKKPLPDDAAERKTVPMATGLIDYFPDALAAVAHVSYVGNQQHNPGEPLHWARGKSGDEADTLIRHFAHRGTADTDGVDHSAKMVWRSLALYQKELEARFKLPLPRGCKAA